MKVWDGVLLPLHHQTQRLFMPVPRHIIRPAYSMTGCRLPVFMFPVMGAQAGLRPTMS